MGVRLGVLWDARNNVCGGGCGSQIDCGLRRSPQEHAGHHNERESAERAHSFPSRTGTDAESANSHLLLLSSKLGRRGGRCDALGSVRLGCRLPGIKTSDVPETAAGCRCQVREDSSRGGRRQLCAGKVLEVDVRRDGQGIGRAEDARARLHVDVAGQGRLPHSVAQTGCDARGSERTRVLLQPDRRSPHRLDRFPQRARASGCLCRRRLSDAQRFADGPCGVLEGTRGCDSMDFRLVCHRRQRPDLPFASAVRSLGRARAESAGCDRVGVQRAVGVSACSRSDKRGAEQWRCDAGCRARVLEDRQAGVRRSGIPGHKSGVPTN
mmetsp:Transcript_46146/g.108287  ORF Transcript_46146/g.108287 Transcript_46146/m.108287 type:complete len:324 (-) Transcript_46146:908-1879(-)